MKIRLPDIPNTAAPATGAGIENFPQRRMSLIFKMFCFVACLGFFSLSSNQLWI
jgi:hypothetical protein